MYTCTRDNNDATPAIAYKAVQQSHQALAASSKRDNESTTQTQPSIFGSSDTTAPQTQKAQGHGHPTSAASEHDNANIYRYMAVNSGTAYGGRWTITRSGNFRLTAKWSA